MTTGQFYLSFMVLLNTVVAIRTLHKLYCSITLLSVLMITVSNQYLRTFKRQTFLIKTHVQLNWHYMYIKLQKKSRYTHCFILMCWPCGCVLTKVCHFINFKTSLGTQRSCIFSNICSTRIYSLLLELVAKVLLQILNSCWCGILQILFKCMIL